MSDQRCRDGLAGEHPLADGLPPQALPALRARLVAA
jgi:hypothetical protein